MKKSYLIAFLLVLLLGPIGLLYSGVGTAILFIITLVLFGFNHSEVSTWLSANVPGEWLNEINPLYHFILGQTQKTSLEFLKGDEVLMTYAVIAWVLFSLLSLVLMPFYISKHNRFLEMYQHNRLRSRIDTLESNLRPKIPEKLQGDCQKCGGIISVKNVECPKCGTTEPFNDKEKLLEYIENNLKSVYLSEEEIDNLSSFTSFFSTIASGLSHLFAWLEKLPDRILDKRERKKIKITFLKGWKEFKFGWAELEKPTGKSVGKFFLYVVGGGLTISGAGLLIAYFFDKASPWILWHIIFAIIVILLIIPLGYLGTLPYKFYEEIFKKKKEALRENYKKDLWGYGIGDDIKKRLLRFANVFREKYPNSDELEEIKEKYFALGEQTKELYKNERLQGAFVIMMIFLFVDFVIFISMIDDAVTGNNLEDYIFPAILAWVAFLIAKSIRSIYYVANTYLSDIYEFDGYYKRFSLREILNYKEKL